MLNFHLTTQKSENFTSTSSFCPKYKGLRQKKNTEIIFHDTEQWCKIWINLDFLVSKLTWGIGWTFIKALKNLKICIFMRSFCTKQNASARKFQKNYVPWHWKLIQNLSENWLVVWKMTRNLINFHISSWKYENLLLIDSFRKKPTKF